jgi:hypothetical protein
VDWDALFDGYLATVDYPGCRYYRQMMEHFPEAKLILTVRDPQKWYESASQTIFQAAKRGRERAEGGGEPQFSFPGDPQLLMRIVQMIQRDIFGGDFGGNLENAQACIDFFERHNAGVIAYVPAGRLLVYEVKQGWEPLCRFLDVPVPEGKPFPHLNERAAFQRMTSGEGPAAFAS